MANERRPASVYGVGAEPDPRFTLANERTTLAWIRTALALVAGGVALISFTSLAPNLPAWAPLIGTASCAGGGLLAIRSIQRWAAVERAMRRREPLPPPKALFVLAIGVIVLAVMVLGLAVFELAVR
ncbi:MAG TPA: DUF202 domain-containing protein [Candidatus Lustribacter sp.]|nr:DUF202 domain-containing protein [Candidatus Lustribacter sp.]